MVETRGGRRFAVLFFVLAFLILFLGRWISPISNVALSIAAPFEAVLNTAANGIGDTVSGVVEGKHWRDQNVLLRKEVAILLHQNTMMQERLREDGILRRMLRFDELNNHLDMLTARVIGGDPNYDLEPSIIINKGRRDGLKTGMTVVDAGGDFVGAIDAANFNNSRVQLMTSPSLTVGAIDTKTRAVGLVDGRYGTTPQLNSVVTQATLHPGDFIVTSGQMNLYPRTILLGQIVRVHHSDVAEFQTADLAPAADFQHLELVQVVRNFVPNAPNKLLVGPNQ